MSAILLKLWDLWSWLLDLMATVLNRLNHTGFEKLVSNKIWKLGVSFESKNRDGFEGLNK